MQWLMNIERICKNCENYGGEDFCLLHRYNLAKCGERKDDFFPSREVLERTGKIVWVHKLVENARLVPISKVTGAIG